MRNPSVTLSEDDRDIRVSNGGEIGKQSGWEEGMGVIGKGEMCQKAPLPRGQFRSVGKFLVCPCLLRLQEWSPAAGCRSTRRSRCNSLPPKRGPLTLPSGLIIEHESNEYIGRILHTPTFNHQTPRAICDAIPTQKNMWVDIDTFR